MKKNIIEFIRRGFIACGFGPLALAIIYLILQGNGVIALLSVNEVCLGIISLSALAFVAGGMNVIYQIDRLPIMVAILIHGGVLYVCYLITYLLNGWLESGITPILVFSGVFVAGYIAIWAFIYSVTRKNAERLNEKLKKRQEAE